MDFNPIILSIPVYFLLIGIELVVQFVADRKLYRLPDALTNISCGITQQLSGIFLKVLGVGAYTYLFTYFSLTEIPVVWWSWILLFVAADFCYYWAHRMSHEINLFWGGHVVHHQSEDYNFSVALRQGSFQIIWTFGFYLPLAIIGFDPVQFVIASALVTVYQFWIHTETIGKLGWIEYILNTPSHHRVHHGRDPKYIDRNHAGVFIVWDRMFGTFQEEEEKPVYGITSPSKSWNPVWLNLEHYYKMAVDMRRMRTWPDRIKFLVKKPGWYPEYLGGYQAPQRVDRRLHKKFDTPFSRPQGFYILMNYLVILGVTAFFLFSLNDFSTLAIVVTSLVIIWTVVNCGGLLEQKTWAVLSEYLRHILIIVAASASLYWGVTNFWLLLTLPVISLAGLFWMTRIYRRPSYFKPSTP